MPKKTKRQKKHADLHKNQSASLKSADFVKSQNLSSEPLPVSGISTSYTYTHHTAVTPKISHGVVDYSYVKHDAIKITIFTIAALAFQGVLYFLINRG